MAEDTKPQATTFSIPQEDALAFSHVQALAQIQTEIQALRQAIPALLTPLLQASGGGQANAPASAGTTPSPGTKGDAKPLDAQLEFRERATKVQGDVVSLVKSLEKICDTLEAAEQVRTDDVDEHGVAQVLPEDLKRTNVVQELRTDGGAPGHAAGPGTGAASTDFLFDGTGSSSLKNGNGTAPVGAAVEPPLHKATDASAAQQQQLSAEDEMRLHATTLGDGDGLQAFANGTSFQDFGLDGYGAADWSNFTNASG